MSASDDPLPHGAYESLVTDALAVAIDAHDGEVFTDALDGVEGALQLTHHLAGLLLGALGSVPAAKRPAAQAELTNQLSSERLIARRQVNEKG